METVAWENSKLQCQDLQKLHWAGAWRDSIEGGELAEPPLDPAAPRNSAASKRGVQDRARSARIRRAATLKAILVSLSTTF